MLPPCEMRKSKQFRQYIGSVDSDKPVAMKVSISRSNEYSKTCHQHFSPINKNLQIHIYADSKNKWANISVCSNIFISRTKNFPIIRNNKNSISFCKVFFYTNKQQMS